MKLTAKRVVALVIAVNLVVIGAIFVRHQDRKHGVADAELKAASPEIHARLKQQISALERESAAESVSQLSDVNPFYWPGPSNGVTSSGGFIQKLEDLLPLQAGAGQSDIEAINSNRRFCKVVEDLGRMREQAVSELVNRELEQATAEYSGLYASEMQKLTPQYKVEKLAGLASFSGPGFVTGNVQKGKVVIAGVRLKVLALVWLCGELRLTDCRTNVVRVAHLALKQRSELYGDPTLHIFFKADMLSKASLYNREIIGSALLGVIADGDGPSRIMNELNVQWSHRKVASFRAVLTDFDLPVQSGAMQPDYSLGSRTLKILPSIDDTQFDLLMAKCGAAP